MKEDNESNRVGWTETKVECGVGGNEVAGAGSTVNVVVVGDVIVAVAATLAAGAGNNFGWRFSIRCVDGWLDLDGT